jgi:hypothetical protein
MIMFWIAVLAVNTLLYVLLDGFDLGVGILFGLARNEEQRRAMQGAVSPVWGRQRDLAGGNRGSCFGAPFRSFTPRCCPHSTFLYFRCGRG